MEKRVELNLLFDFYGALLTGHRQELMRAYIEEDLSLKEIADEFGITRQGVHDAITKAQEQLEEYERKLGLLKRYRRLSNSARRCREELLLVQQGDIQALDRALYALNDIEDTE